MNQFVNKLPADAASKLAAMPFEPVVNQVMTDVQAQSQKTDATIYQEKRVHFYVRMNYERDTKTTIQIRSDH